MSSAVYKYLRYLKSQIFLDNSTEFLAIDLSFICKYGYRLLLFDKISDS